MKELTILSVYHSLPSRDLLTLNYELTKRINSGDQWQWFVGDNTPRDLNAPLDSTKFTTVPGMSIQEIADGLPEELKSMKGSYHHATALNRLVAAADTRYLLILDNDFYIVYPEWISQVLAYMKHHDLAFFGAPWHPRWWKKVRYFPAQFAMFVDTEKIDKATLDFLPAYDEAHPPSAASLKSITYPRGVMRIPVLHSLVSMVARRSRIGSSRDTSYRIYAHYYRSGVKYESIIPALPLPANQHTFVRSATRLIKRLLPERFFYTPKNERSYTTRGFRARGYTDVFGKTGWEEYIWQDRPFAFHLKGESLWQGDAKNRKAEVARDMINGLLQGRESA